MNVFVLDPIRIQFASGSRLKKGRKSPPPKKREKNAKVWKILYFEELAVLSVGPEAFVELEVFREGLRKSGKCSFFQL
jgi:hypothetical protein